jgi:uncharacterized circularly permuted ATP-grasp superfamily protein
MPGDIVREYNSLFERQPDLLDRSRDYLLERFRDVKLIFGGRTLSPYLRPHFVARAEWQVITSACETVWAAIEKVGRRAPGDPEMLDELALTDAELRLAAIDPGYEDVSVSSRLDSFLKDDSYRFVELNAECPAGIAYGDVAAEVFMNLPIMREFALTHNVSPMYCRQDLLDALLAIYWRVRGKGTKPAIAIVDYRGLPTQREFELFKDYFEAAGYDATIADPRELDFKDGRLCHGDFKIDLIYRRVLVTEFLQKIDECRAMVEAYRSGAVVVVNSFRTKYIHKKMLFGILTDERFSSNFNQVELAAIRAHVPWTRRVKQVATNYLEQKIDLVEFVRQNRDRLVLKPNDDYGGHGIFIGWELEQSGWESAIQSALAADYLVQQRVATGREIFPFVNEAEGGRVDMVEQLLDVDPLLFFGRVGGAFTRLSSSSLANVTSGGGMVPTILVD